MKHLFYLVMITSLLAACNSGGNKAAEAQIARQKTIDSLNMVLVRQKTIDSMKIVNARTVKKNTQVVETVTVENSKSTTAKKKTMSHTAKGAIVGAVTGAVSGAIINHEDRAKGAVIGTVIGTGIGAGTGLIVDESKKKKAKKKKTAN